METIIGLLFILLPVIFKLIGKRLEQSGQQEKADKLQKVVKALAGNEEEDKDEESPFLDRLGREPKMDKDMYVEYDDDGYIISVQPRETYVPKQPKPIVTDVPAARSTGSESAAPFKPTGRKNMILEDEAPKEREKIDPKKLVIYSEIMKPKY